MQKWNPARLYLRWDVSGLVWLHCMVMPAYKVAATYHGAGENTCEATDPDALRTLFAVFA